MENELLTQLGINLPLFISQAVNFFIILIILTIFVYKPVIKIIKERTAKIKEGLEKAEQADVRMAEIEEIGKGKIKEAEHQSIEIIKATEVKAKALDKENQEKAEKKQKEVQDLLRASFAKQQEEAKSKVLAEAGELVKKVIMKTVELKPAEIDEALIKKAVESVKNEAK
jgi:F-type H+-transporting ATPase subunit b